VAIVWIVVLLGTVAARIVGIRAASTDCLHGPLACVLSSTSTHTHTVSLSMRKAVLKLDRKEVSLRPCSTWASASFSTPLFSTS
jgi:hypothetical protein